MATIEKRGNTYRIVVSAGYAMDGKQIRRRMTWTPEPGMTERQIAKEVQRQAVLFEEKVMSGQVLDGSIRFADFAEYWMKEYAEKQLRPSTIHGYQRMIDRILPALGNIRLDRLQPRHLMEFYNELAIEGRLNGLTYTAKRDLSALAKERGLRHKDITQASGVPKGTVAQAFRGVAPISKKSAQGIAAALNLPLDRYVIVVYRNETRRAVRS